MGKIGWVFGFVLAARAADSAASPTALDDRMEITVHIYNPAGAPKQEISRAEREAAWLFERAGIYVNWVECPPPVPERGADQVCKESADRRLFVLAITSEEPPDRSAGALGFALVFGRSNHAVAVYPRITAEAEKHPDYRDCILLGSVMAHELAHLLFRSTLHGKGIMQANWIRRDFQAMRQRQLIFNVEQAQTLRRMLAARIEQSPTGPRAAR